MDHKEIQAIWDAFQSVQEKKLSDKQKALDVDNDGDIEGDDLAALRNNKRKLKRGVTEKSICPKCDGKGCAHCDDKGVHEEAPADPVKKAPARKGDKSNSDSSDLKAVKEDVEQIEEGPLTKRALDRKGQDFVPFRVAKTPKARKYLAKKQGEKNAEINKNDPKMAVVYGRSIVDTDKAVKNAVKKGLDKDKVKKSLNWRHRNSAQKSKLPEEVELRWAQSLAEMLSDISEKKDEHTKGATESEKYDSKFSKGSKDFVAMHQKSDKEMEDKEQKGHDDVSKAGRATKASAGRGAADQLKNGDKSVVKPVSGVVTKETK